MSVYKYISPLEKHTISGLRNFSFSNFPSHLGQRTRPNMKILALAFIMALMFAMIGADSSSEEKHHYYRDRYYGGGGAYPYPYQPYPQPYPYPYPYGR
ncbi:statherin [Pteronotus mesoamericanus]|uniref:statherin n=1 Tax=Pteronotus mesoamericanus TaxID=1884717 RepID=UPI0023EDDF59|nr:statherin [Pteronotus parnellii mesoamericanus]